MLLNLKFPQILITFILNDLKACHNMMIRLSILLVKIIQPSYKKILIDKNKIKFLSMKLMMERWQDPKKLLSLPKFNQQVVQATIKQLNWDQMSQVYPKKVMMIQIQVHVLLVRRNKKKVTKLTWIPVRKNKNFLTRKKKLKLLI